MALLRCSRGYTSVCSQRARLQALHSPRYVHFILACMEDVCNGLFVLLCGSVGHC